MQLAVFRSTRRSRRGNKRSPNTTAKYLHKALLLFHIKGLAEKSQLILNRIASFLNKLDIMSMWKIVVQVGRLLVL